MATETNCVHQVSYVSMPGHQIVHYCHIVLTEYKTIVTIY
jgi:hypothetical protein